MTTVNRAYTFSAGAIIIAEQFNVNETTLYNVINGMLNTDNLMANAGILGSQLSPTAAIEGSQLALSTITSDLLALGAVLTENISDNAITADKIAANAVYADKILANSITSDKIAANSIAAYHISADAITANAILAGAITSAKITTGAITAEKIAAGAITSDKFDSHVVTTDAIASDAITTITLAASAVTAEKIATNAVTADKINVASLSAISADLGTVTAGTITAATVQTSADPLNNRVLMNSNGLVGYSAVLGQVFNLPTSGAAPTFSSGNIISATIINSTMISNNFKTSETLPFVLIDDSGLSYVEAAANYKYNTFKYNEGIYGPGVTAYVMKSDRPIVSVEAERIYADVRYYNRSTVPSGPAIVGDTAVVNGDLKLCTTLGTPGTYSTLYRAGGTDVAVADGGTGKSSWTQYLIPYADTTTSLSQIAIGSSNQVLKSNGAGSAPSFQDMTAVAPVQGDMMFYMGVEEQLANGTFETWTGLTDEAVNGDMETGSPPSSWVLTGSGATWARESTIIKEGTYSGKLTRAGTNCYVSQTVTFAGGASTDQYVLGAWVYQTSGAANRARIQFVIGGNYDEVYHSGVSTGWEYLSCVVTNPSSATGVINLLNYNSDGSVYFDKVKCYKMLAPTSWTLVGSGMTAEREESIIKTGTYSVKVTRKGTNGYIRQDIQNAGGHNLDYWKGRTITFGCWVYGGANSGIDIYDGIGHSFTAHSATVQWEYITSTKTIDASATAVYLWCYQFTTDESAYFDVASVSIPAGWQRIPVGTSGQTLKLSASLIPTWTT